MTSDRILFIVNNLDDTNESANRQDVVYDDNDCPAGWDRAETCSGDWDAPR